jgi:hypothetical protein
LYTQGVFEKRPNFCFKDIIAHFTAFLSTIPFKVVPSTGDTPFSTFLPMLECFLERNYVMARSYAIAFS